MPQHQTGFLYHFLFPPQQSTSSKTQEHHKTFPWYMVLWLTGVDYFSTLGYQPGIAFLAGGILSPIATALLVLVTLFAALPTYRQVAGKSFAGQGSIAMLEDLIPGWKGKIFVLVMIGFTATAFVITMTLSAADAAAHAVENPLLHQWLKGAAMPVTLGLLILLAVVFMMGFTEALSLALVAGVPYIFLNIIVIAYCMVSLFQHPEYLNRWTTALMGQGDVTGIILASCLIFPKLALGLSGFETGVAVMPLVSGKKTEGNLPVDRIKNTRKMLTSAAFLMSVMLISSSLVTTLLIPAEEFAPGGKANGRALAYLAHSMLGPIFGTIYDFSTIAILWFAGASAMVGLLSLIPRYLPRFGMSPQWLEYTRPLVLLILFINMAVTWAFQANVDKQAGAYATGVLALMLSAAVAVPLSISRGEEELEPQPRGKRLYFWLMALVFAYALFENIKERPDGIIIASIFIGLIIFFSIISRWQRTTELRVEELQFADEKSDSLWDEIKNKKVNVVPIQHFEELNMRKKSDEIHKYFKIEGPLAFLHVGLLNNRSEFISPLHLTVRYVPGDNEYLIVARNAVAIANAIAYLSEQIDPISITLGLTGKNRTRQSLKYLLFGEGEVGIWVYQILVQHWERTYEADVRPLIFLLSD